MRSKDEWAWILIFQGVHSLSEAEKVPFDVMEIGIRFSGVTKKRVNGHLKE